MKKPRPEVRTRLPVGRSRCVSSPDFKLSAAAGQATAPEDNWRRLGDVVSDIIARQYDLTRQHARVVAEHNFRNGDRS